MVTPTTQTSVPATGSAARDRREGNAVQPTSGGMANDEPGAPTSPASGVAPLDLFAYHDAAVQSDGAIFVRTFIAEEALVEVLSRHHQGCRPKIENTSPHLSAAHGAAEAQHLIAARLWCLFLRMRAPPSRSTWTSPS